MKIKFNVDESGRGKVYIDEKDVSDNVRRLLVEASPGSLTEVRIDFIGISVDGEALEKKR